MGVNFDALTEVQVVERVIEKLGHGSGGWICPVNLDVLRQCAEDDAVRELVQSADIVLADGMPVVWASHVAGEPLPQRVAGSSLTFSLTAAAGRQGASVYLLGGNPGAAEGAAARLKQRNPALRIAGTACPSLGFEKDDHQLNALERDLHDADPDIVFLAFGFPKQDRLAVRLRRHFPHMWFVSCGISLSYASGEIRRAPRPLQVLGLEWLYRLAQQPRALFHRYLIVGPPFAARLLLSTLDQRARRAMRQRDAIRGAPLDRRTCRHGILKIRFVRRGNGLDRYTAARLGRASAPRARGVPDSRSGRRWPATGS